MAAEPPPEADAESPGEAALARVLRRPPLPPEALARMQAAVVAQWRAEHPPRAQRPSQRRWRSPVAAALALAAVLALWLHEGFASGPVLGVVRSHDPAGLLSHRRLFRDSPLGEGDEVRTGRQLTAVATTEVALQGGGSLIIRQGSVLDAAPQGAIRLRSGTVYVDLDPTASHGELTVRTPLGELHHVGTQFEVTVRVDEERIAVREGTVRIAGRISTTLAAGQAIVLGTAGIQATETIRPYDREWRWVAAATDPPAVEGASAAVFLHWFSRTTGRQLSWADDKAEQLAERTTLHGSIDDLAIDVAARAVLATTSLRVHIDETTISVAVDPAAKTVP